MGTRTFLAIDFETSTNEELKKFRDISEKIIEKNKFLKTVKFKLVDKFHITLEFFGVLNENQLSKLTDYLKENKDALKIHNKKLTILKLNFFTKFDNLIKTHMPSVIYLQTESRELENLQKKIKYDLLNIESFNNILFSNKSINFSREKNTDTTSNDIHQFTQHITIARINCDCYDLKTQKEFSKLIKLLNKQFHLKIAFAKKLVLYKSTLTPKGPVYEEIYGIDF